MSDIIPFYGACNPGLFSIERSSMDRSGKIIDFLNANLPQGLILDIGAGNGFTARRIRDRRIICLEPDPNIIPSHDDLLWVKGSAENIPFHDSYFDAAYSTFAYFLAGVDKSKGLAEVERVLKGNGTIIIIDNFGDDEFTSFSSGSISEGPEFYHAHGFTSHVLHTSFQFASLEDANTLMSFYFGENIMRGNIKQTYEYKVVAYTKILSEQGASPNHHAFGTFGTSPAEQALGPKASGDR